MLIHINRPSTPLIGSRIQTIELKLCKSPISLEPLQHLCFLFSTGFSFCVWSCIRYMLLLKCFTYQNHSKLREKIIKLIKLMLLLSKNICMPKQWKRVPPKQASLSLTLTKVTWVHSWTWQYSTRVQESNLAAVKIRFEKNVIIR